MKNVKMILTAAFIMVITLVTSAQDTTSDFFVDNWKVKIFGTPNGDAEVVFHLERVDGKLGGEVRNDTGDPVKIDRIEEKESTITVYYMAMGYDINIFLQKVDDNNLKGNLLGMFDVKAERVSE